MQDLIRNKTIIVGSTYFFSQYSDFHSKDIDKVEVVDYPVEFEHYQQIQLPHKDIFRWVKLPVDQMIAFELKCDCAMQLGKYLIPEFIKSINMTLQDLEKLRPLRDALDEKHLYEQVIYDSYMDNGDFILTDKQRLEAYQMYKKYRN